MMVIIYYENLILNQNSLLLLSLLLLLCCIFCLFIIIIFYFLSIIYIAWFTYNFTEFSYFLIKYQQFFFIIWCKFLSHFHMKIKIFFTVPTKKKPIQKKNLVCKLKISVLFLLVLFLRKTVEQSVFFI